MGDDKPVKKRPRDILASLDAAFASSATTKTSKYTAQAAQQTNAAAAQQAYQHGKHKKKKANQQNQQKPKSQTAAAGGSKNPTQQRQQQQKEPYEPLYGRLDVDTLRVGLKNCSLSGNAASVRKSNVLHATLKQYIGAFTNEGNAASMTDKLKNKVLQFDNPIRTATGAAKQQAVMKNNAQAQSSRLLSARQRRKLGLHMVASDAIEYGDAEKLCEIWRRYARDVIGNDFVGDHSDVAARTARLQAKLRTIDLSGCPIEVIKARNPLNVGIVGIIVADKTQVLQVCVPGRSKVITLPKLELRLRVSLDDNKSFFMDGQWLLGASHPK